MELEKHKKIIVTQQIKTN